MEEKKHDRKITIDFSKHEIEFEWLVNNAMHDCRPLDWQVIALIKEIIEGKWEYQA